MLISQATLDAHVGPDPKRVLALYTHTWSAEVCLGYWNQTLTPDRLRKILQDARAAQALAVPVAVEEPVEPPNRHHRKLSIEREDEIITALATAECVADVARALQVTDQVIYRICRERGIIWPVLTPERRAARIKAVHARVLAEKAAAKAEELAPTPENEPSPEPVQLDLIEWIDALDAAK